MSARLRTILLKTSMRADVASATSARGFWPRATTGGRGKHFVQPPDDAVNGGDLVSSGGRLPRETLRAALDQLTARPAG